MNAFNFQDKAYIQLNLSFFTVFGWLLEWLRARYPLMDPSNLRFHHPYDPYSIQLEFMQKLYTCIEDSNIGVFESPTGTGKTLSLICAALTWLRDDEKRRTHGVDESETTDWLELAERKAQRQQLIDARDELEHKLERIRKRSRQEAQLRPGKRVKREDQFQEHEFLLDEYDSDREQHSISDENSLSSATLALLQKLQPTSNDPGSEQEEQRTKIIFCSRTHSQLTQFVGELRKIQLPSAVVPGSGDEVLKHIPLGSRKNLCINPQVSRLNSTIAINQRCLELQKTNTARENKCAFLPSQSSSEDKVRVQEFKDYAIAEVQDIEDIASLGQKMKLCPYYASRSAISTAEIISLPYPLLLQRDAREALGIEIKDNVIIIDEAHNLNSAIAETLTVNMPHSHLILANQQLLGYCQKFRNKLKGKNRVYIAQILRVMKSCIARLELAIKDGKADVALTANDLMSAADQIHPYKLINYIHECKLIYKVEGYSQLLEDQAQTQSGGLALSIPAQQPKGVLAEFQSLLAALANPTGEGKFFASRNEQEMVLKYVLLDPQAHFEEIVQSARSIILAGGTMSPMSEWAEQLFSYVDHDRLKTYSFSHIVSKSNVMVKPLPKGPNGTVFDFTFAQRSSETMLDDLGLALEAICKQSPDGVVVFFASYDYLALVVKRWKASKNSEALFMRIQKCKPIFQETRTTAVDELLHEYSNAIECGTGAVLLAVVGGKLSEGINFSDRLGRVVVCVGLPYPNVNSAEWKAKVDFIEAKSCEVLKKEGLSEREIQIKSQAKKRDFTDNLTLRAVNQSIGRAIRHKNDYAAIILVDKRYLTPRIQSKLPYWLKDSLHDASHSWQAVEDDISRFFNQKRS